MKTKKCKDCLVDKNSENFSKNGKGYLNTYCKECATERTRKWLNNLSQEEKSNYDSIRKKKFKIYFEENRELVLERGRKNRKSEKSKKWYREYNKRKRGESLNFKIKSNLRHRIRCAIKDNIKSDNTVKLVGCEIDFLLKYLESKFKEGMSWENYGAYELGKPMTWHIDHIKPCASFDLTDPEQQKICFHYTNLQPLWAIDNIVKKDKVESELKKI